MCENEVRHCFSERSAVSLLILAGICAYCNCLTKAFVLDDLAWINGSEEIASPSDYMRSPLGRSRPVIALSLLLNHQTGGLNPVGYHALNALAHVLAGLVLFGIMRLTLMLERWPEHYRAASSELAFAVALLWMVHPLQTQSVTYVIQRCESFMGLFFLLTLYCSIRGWGSQRPALWHLAAMLSCALGAGSKEVIAGAPFLVVLYDWVFRESSVGKLLRRRWKL